MKSNQIKTSTFFALKSFAKKTLQLMIITVITSSITYNVMYANNNSDTIIHDNIRLTGYSKGHSDFLQWEITNPYSVAYFTILCAKNNDMNFNEVISINPYECFDMNKNSTFNFNCLSNIDHDQTYYKIRITCQDNQILESNYISFNNSKQNGNSLNISGIKNQGGQIMLTFDSPTNQNLVLNISNRSGQLLAANNIIAMQGINTYYYNNSNVNPNEMLIFSLNNQDEQITKKFMLSSAW